MPTIQMTGAQIQAIVDHARDGRPNEVCGVLAGTNRRVERIYRANNVLQSRYRYEIDGLEMLKIHRDFEDRDLDLIGFYHSHTHTEAFPSPTDIALSAQWPDATYFIVSLKYKPPPLLAFQINRDDTVTEVPITIVEAADSAHPADVVAPCVSSTVAATRYASAVDDFGPTVELPRETAARELGEPGA